MSTFENILIIEKPVEEVFSFLADLENLPKWNYFVKRVSKTSDGPVESGATYHQVRETDEQELRIVELEPNQSLVVETIPPSKPEMRREMIFSEKDSVTQIEDRWQLELGVPGMVEPYVTRRMKFAVNENLKKLKELLETGEVVLEDGRQSSLG